VAFAFRPRIFYAGLAVSLVSLTLMVIALAVTASRRRSPMNASRIR
jgi:hypothetical protein